MTVAPLIIRNPKLIREAESLGGNSPLPDDYPSLTAEGQRLARVNACCLWRAAGSTPRDRVRSMIFFDNFYLKPEDSNFYEGRLLPTPPIHHRIIHDMAAHRRNLISLPRFFGKSMLMRKDSLLDLVTAIRLETAVLTSSHRLLRLRHFGPIKAQLEDNPRLRDDFGNLVPPRGKGAFDADGLIILPANNNALTGFSVDGKYRGAHPQKFKLDDPEYDPEASTDMEVLREKLASLLFRKILPSLRDWDLLTWTGTLLSKQHMIYLAIHDNEDTRFKSWHKIYTGHKAPSGEYVWPEVIGPHNEEQWKLDLGPGAFASEIANDPGDPEAVTFHLGPVPNHPQNNWYSARNLDSALLTDPFSSQTLIDIPNLSHPNSLDSMLMSRFVTYLGIRILIVDGAETWGPQSDFSAITVWGLAPNAWRFALDAWQGRLPPEKVADAIWSRARRWRVHIIASEDVAKCAALNHQITSKLPQKLHDLPFAPRPMFLRPPREYSKEQKISALDTFIHNGYYLFPKHLRTNPGMHALISQFEQYNGGAMNGGLSHDDLIDTAQMLQQVITRLPSGPGTPLPRTLAEHLDAGQWTLPDGTDARALMLTHSQLLPPHVFNRALTRVLTEAFNPRRDDDTIIDPTMLVPIPESLDAHGPPHPLDPEPDPHGSALLPLPAPPPRRPASD